MYNKNGKHSLSIPRSLSPTRWAGKDFRLFDPKWYDTATASFMRDNSDPSVQALQRLAMKMYPTGRAPVSELCGTYRILLKDECVLFKSCFRFVVSLYTHDYEIHFIYFVFMPQ
jgi:hypothetical protein